MEEVRRESDDELCGFVAAGGEGRWRALAIFGVPFGEHGSREGAVRHVLEVGLACLGERWTLVEVATGAEEVVCIQEADPAGVTVALGYDSLPGVPTRRLASEELVAGAWSLRPPTLRA